MTIDEGIREGRRAMDAASPDGSQVPHGEVGQALVDHVSALGRPRRPVKAPKSPRRCFLCCEPIVGKWTAEHFVSRCFYPDRKIPNEPNLTLPAHAKCNKSTSDNEEWVSQILSLSNPMGLPLSPSAPAHERWNRTQRSLTMPRPNRPEGRASDFLARVVDLPGGGAALPMGADRYLWVLAKIAKGLSYRECGLLWGPDTEWSARVCDYAAFVAAPQAPLFVEIPARGDIASRGSVLLAKGAVTEAGMSLYMVLLGQHPVMLTTMSREEHRAMKERLRSQYGDEVERVEEHDFSKLKWPRQRATGATAIVEG